MLRLLPLDVDIDWRAVFMLRLLPLDVDIDWRAVFMLRLLPFDVDNRLAGCLYAPFAAI